jgi:phage recombination protein Bet
MGDEKNLPTVITRLKDGREVTQADFEVAKRVVGGGKLNSDEIYIYIKKCADFGVHPLDGKIHPVARGSGDNRAVAFQCGIDYFRSLAVTTQEYAGQEDIEYGSMMDVEGFDKKVPESAKATVLRISTETGEIRPVSATVYWDEFCPSGNQAFMWKKMPRLMLGKCAEAQALRKAFPKPLAGLYADEEMHQAEAHEIVIEDMPPAIEPPEAPNAPESDKKPSGGARDSKPKETLKAELVEYAGDDKEVFAAILKRVTVFKNAEDKEIYARTIDKVSTDAWAGKALGKLRDIVKNEKEIGCGHKADECGQCVEEGDPIKATCEATKLECPWWNPF